MAFWIVMGLVAVMLIIGVIYSIVDDDWGEGMRGGIVAAVLVAIMGFIVIGVGVGSQQAGSNGTPTLQKTWALRALVTKDQTESSASASFFLGFGSASASSSTVTSVYYIRTAKDGGSTLQKTSIGRTVIYEDAKENPYVEDWVSVGYNDGAFWPWPFRYTVSGEPQHRFHIPKGSILESYSVTP